MRLMLAAAVVWVFGATPAPAACILSAVDAAAAGPGCARAWMDRNLHLNDILTVGTHNSYKAAVPGHTMALIRIGSSDAARELDYSHPMLPAQLDDGARAIELDVVYDPEGGLYKRPAAAAMTGERLPEGYVETMSKPGFKVMHVQDIDFHSVCLTLIVCLKDLKTWSDDHRDHVPILVTINTKDDEIAMPGSVTPLKFDTAAFDALDAEIRSVMTPADLITPDEVQGNAPTLRDAVLTKGWPTLGEARGRFLFALDEEGDKLKAYIGGRKSLEGRVMFVNAPEDSPTAAYLTLNETSDISRITDDVKKGFIVRTRADADTKEARANDTSRRDKAMVSGAQYVSTDYMRPDARFGPYQARMPDGVVAACNPVRAAGRCGGLPVEAAPTPVIAAH